jgi:iron complex outermembrane recepter protein
MLDRMSTLGLTALLAAALTAGAASSAFAQEEHSGGAPEEAAEAAASDAETGSEAADPAADVAPESEPASSADTPPETELLPTISVADRSGPPQEPAPTPNPKAHLEEIVVTATKREKSLRDIPASISAFDGDQLEILGNLGLTDYLQKKPGVTITEISPGLVRMSVRGISTDASPLSPLPSATGVFIGDTAFSDAYISNIQPDLSAFDLSTVEVLKGPQGTLFGGTALAGAVRYVLNKPEMGVWQARGFTQYVSATEGSTALTSGVALNAPVYEDALAVRLGYVNRKYPGVTDIVREERLEDVDEGGGEQLRGILAWQPVDKLRFELTHLAQDYAADMAVTTTESRDRRENPRTILPVPTFSDFQLNSLDIAYDFETMRLISLSSLIEKNWDLYADSTAALVGVPPPGYPPELGAFLTIRNYSDAFSQELRLQSVDSDLQWMIGAYLYKLDLLFELFIDTIAHQMLLGASGYPGDVDTSSPGNETSLLYALTNNEATEQALFLDVGYTFWDALEVSAGARFYKTRVRGGFFGTGVLAKGINNGMNVNYTDNDLQEDGVNPKFTATYHFTPSISTYVQAAKGYRFGGLQSVPSTPNNSVPISYKSDSLWNYELGLRTSWFDNTLQFDPTVFYIDYKNPQIVQSTTGIPINYTDNVGAAESKGWEAQLRWLTPIPGLTLNLAGGVTESRTTVPFTAAGGEDVPPGAWLPGSAESQYSAAIDWLGFIDRPFNVAAHVDYTYIGRAFANIQNTIPVNDYATLNVGLIFSNTSWRLRPTLALNVANVLDETAATYGSIGKPIINFEGNRNYESFILNPPRTISARLALEF